ncbi:large ribosomal subunit protein bL32m-like [Pongo abelii]|uniref:large ribosomal subunit protein bL32m-like n=1 Tax=Pongo abelii TaxID=9601 RepID=UPI0023E8B854|nr:39S ribosomal protein L32, mitochondrial-like [Pongo abelii]
MDIKMEKIDSEDFKKGEAERRGLLQNYWEQLLRKLPQSWPGFPSSPWGPALAVHIYSPAIFTEPANDTSGSKENSSLLYSIFWIAAPQNRRTIEVNLCRRRNPQKLIKVKNSIDVCPECGHLKQKYVLCGYCYEKVRKETAEIRRQTRKQEGGPFKSPTIETMVLYTGETPSEQDQGKRMIERDRKRPSWFTQNWHQRC